MPPPLLHVIGAGPWQLPTIRRAQALGLRVLATDGFAERPGYAIADLHELADITDADATLHAARRHRIDGVLCDTTDTGVRSAAFVAESLGLPGVGAEAARYCTDKAAMTACIAAAGLRVPRWREVANAGELAAAAEAIGFPLVVKPIDAQGGRGVSVVHGTAALEAALQAAMTASRSGKAIVQSFVRGIEIIVDSLIVAGRVHRLGLARKTAFDDNPTVSSRITYGATELPASAAAIDELNTATLKALGIRQGLVHAEYLIDGEGAVPVDVAARGGGVMIYSTVLPHVSGVDAMQAAIRLALGQAADAAPRAQRGANIEFLRVPSGRVVSIEGVDDARTMPGIAAVHLFHGVGDTVRALQDKEDRLGFVVALADDAEAALAQSQRASQRIRARIEPGSTGA